MNLYHQIRETIADYGGCYHSVAKRLEHEPHSISGMLSQMVKKELIEPSGKKGCEASKTRHTHYVVNGQAKPPITAEYEQGFIAGWNAARKEK